MAEKNSDSAAIDVLLQEDRRFSASEEFKANAVVRDDSLYKRAAEDREAFWGEVAEEMLDWFKPWDKVLEWDPPYAKWFVGGKINASYNCLDRHVKAGRGAKRAIIWEGEPGDEKVLTYDDLYLETNKFANVLKSLGVTRGDRVAICMPMIPELAIALLACARIGAVHSVVFGGFSAESLRDRINDAQAKLLITADGGYRRGKIVELKQIGDDAIAETPSIEKTVVVKRTGHDIEMKDGRDLWYHDLMAEAEEFCEPEQMDSEDMLYILYTSGTTGKPKGIIHTTAGYLTGVTATFKWIFDLKEDDVYWCTADIGWVTGHSYIVYGPLSNGATVVMYEGAPNHPENDRFWDICQRHKVTILYTAPTAIRTFMKWGTEWPAKHDLSSLRLLGTVGEPINPEAWIWYHEHIGGGRCPVVDTWWQTETGMILISPLPGVTELKPGSATHPLPGIEAEILNDNGERVPVGGGYLALTSPWPAMLRGIYGDPDRYVDQYWSRWKDIYFTGDGSKRDEEGYFWLLGRVDDVMNVAGHRIGTMEVESALVDHSKVAESAVVGVPDEIKGTAIAAFVTLVSGNEPGRELEDELKGHVVHKIGAIARPAKIIFTADLPKTRSGKIMRRLLRDIAGGKVLGDTSTLADPSVVQTLKQRYEDED